MSVAATSPALPLLVTMGDACGIGPEIIIQAHQRGALGDAVVIGSRGVMARAAQVVQQAQGGDLVSCKSVASLAQARATLSGALRVWEPPRLVAHLADLPWGQVRAEAGAAAACCIEAAVAAVRAGEGAGIVTAPIHKEALSAAGVSFPGHTEMLQALCVSPGAPLPPVRMMLANEELRVVLVTIHVSLRRAIEMLDVAGIVETLRITHEAALRFGMAAPRIAVAGLNPHAGEGGLFGDEEIHIISPAIAQARALGMNVTGPFAPDTVFMRARHAPGHPGEFDFVLAMTHDHGLIPVKYLGVEQGVNVTLGLPLVRTSPDHGTAFDIAGQGVADASSLVAAMQMARRLTHAATGH
ncbi:4-hydroxythreonine-4-phosphate dehydrogenase PdxA [Ideonella sp.]|jgi:4-hydroxythreonine-4-phosphate dehydrogenase|uniref:4-hydroxythreonine-4-phosphate dehydrogenase PdxA n=1 Tax=Ideonella sp. TaxID=1929293 RepID=UPI0037C154BA